MSRLLTVAMNLTDPLAWLGFRPTCELADELGLQLRWRPLRTAGLTAPVRPQGVEADRGSWHRFHRACNRDRDLRRYAAVQGLELRDLHRQVDGTPSALALLWFGELGDEAALRDWLGSVLAAGWSGTLDLEDPAAVAATLPKGGVEFRQWVSDAGLAQLEETEAELRAAGLAVVPAYLLDDEPFQGRGHLPMLRWIAGGRQGPAPI